MCSLCQLVTQLLVYIAEDQQVNRWHDSMDLFVTSVTWMRERKFLFYLKILETFPLTGRTRFHLEMFGADIDLSHVQLESRLIPFVRCRKWHVTKEQTFSLSLGVCVCRRSFHGWLGHAAAQSSIEMYPIVWPKGKSVDIGQVKVKVKSQDKKMVIGSLFFF